jgi:DNA polymerase I
MTKRLVVIDGKSVFYRGYYAMPTLATKDGTPTGGVYGFASISLEIIRQLKPDYVAVAWDKKGTNIRRRKEIYSEYKAGRKPAPPDFYVQIPILHELLGAFGWPLYECDDYEADDIMGTLSTKANKEGVETILITSDLDMLQLIDNNTHVYALKKGFSQIEEFNLASFEQKYGLRQDQFLDLKALKGDSSDNIPGVAGVGDKTATQLLQTYGTLDGVYEHIDDIKGSVQTKLIAGKESAYMSRRLAEIWCDAPVEFDAVVTDVTKLDHAKLRAMLEKLEFRSLLRNLPESMQDMNAAEVAATRPVESTEIRDYNDKDASTMASAQVVVVSELDDKVIVSPSKDSAFLMSWKQASELLLGKDIIAFDAKPLLKQLIKKGMTQLPLVTHDVRQAAFLLDATRRWQQLEDVVGYGVAEDSGAVIHAVWQSYDEQTKLLSQQPAVQKIAHEIDFPLIPILARMESRGIEIDPGFFATMSDDLEVRLTALEKEAHELVGRPFNLASPSQLAVVLFEDLALPTKGIKKGKTGYSTGIKELEKLRGQHPLIEIIEKTRELSKLKNTYVDTLPKAADETHRVHTTYNQDGAATGRLSSTDPALMNIPVRTEIGKKIRQGFVASKDMVFVSADYSQFELRLAAVLSGDDTTIAAFNSDEDIHVLTAAQVQGIDPREVTSEMRYKAKAVNFGILYGQGSHGLAEATGMSFGEAKSFIDRYYEVRPKLKNYMDSLRKKAHEDGYVETFFGRRRPTPDVKSSNFIVRSAAERAAMNMPIQGTAADLTKKAMIAVEQELTDDAHQLLQIHDSILLECREENAEDVATRLKAIMESVQPDLGVKLKVDVSTGKHWSDV